MHAGKEPHMATAAQITANQANAQLSTGPQTQEGNAKVAQNARKHGLCAQYLIVRDDEQEDFEALASQLRDQLSPQGSLEDTLFDNLLLAKWNMARCTRLEQELMANALGASGNDPLLDDSAAGKLNRIQSYFRARERSFYRALKELKAIQTERAFRDLVFQDAPELHDLAPTIQLAQARSAYVKEQTQFLRFKTARVNACLAGQIPISDFVKAEIAELG